MRDYPVEVCDMDENCVYLPIPKEEAAKLKEGQKFTATVKGVVKGAIAREGEAAEYCPEGEVILSVESVKIEGKSEMAEFLSEE